MKFLITFILMLCAAFAFPQANMSIGQDLGQYLADFPPAYKVAGPTIIAVKEGTIDFYAYKAQTTNEDIKVLYVLDKFPIGVLQNNMGKSQILLDLDLSSTV